MPTDDTCIAAPTVETVPAVKYLFTILYLDGSVFQQPVDDLSLIDPARSAFTDATSRIKDGQFVRDANGELVSRMHEIHRFLLQGPNDDSPSYMVDINTGHFEINCAPFRLHNIETEYYNRRLIFARRHYHQIMTANNQSKTLPERIVYRLGWQGNLSDGKSEQFVMEID